MPEYVEVRVPQQGLTVESVTVCRWLKAVGDSVAEGEPLLEILSDKANLEVEAPVSGTVSRILIEADQEASVAGVVALISPAPLRK